MRVLHIVATPQQRGAELFANDLIGALERHGIEQHIVVLRENGGSSIQFQSPTTRLATSRRTIPNSPMRLPDVLNLRRIVVEWRPQVIQAHGGEAFKSTTVAALGTGIPVVYRRIGMAPSWIGHGPKRLAHSALMRRATQVIAVAEAVRQETIERFHVADSRVVTIPNGVSLLRLQARVDRRTSRKRLGIPDEAPVTISLGALTWEKDPWTHLEVVERAVSVMPCLVHLIIGDGPLRAEIETESRRLGLERNVMLLGSRNDVAELLAAGDVLIFASREDGMEGMPASVIEAGIAGLPVVGYAVAGIPEVVTDGVTGSLVRPRDGDQLSHRLIQLLADGGRRNRFARAAQMRCREFFDIEKIAPRYLDVYESLSRRRVAR